MSGQMKILPPDLDREENTMTKRTALTCGRAACTVLMMIAALPLSARTESVIYNFTGGNGGGNPEVGLTSYKSSLYSTLLNGGSAGAGEVYKLTPPKTGTTWNEKALVTFQEDGNPGGSPNGRVIADQYGNLYGVTTYNDSIGTCCGLVYELSPPPAGQTEWTSKIICQFPGGVDGLLPHGGLAMDQYGALYGATMAGGTYNQGTIFRLYYNIRFGWILEVLYSFTGGDDGGTPNGDLLIDSSNGNIFGTTPSGGYYNLGTVFSLSPPTGAESTWAFATIHDFEGDATDAQDGATPNGGLAGATGDLFGTTQTGGASEKCCGMVFELRQEIEGNPQYTLINHHNFTGGQDGAYAKAGFFKDSSGNLWSTTEQGGSGTTGSDFGTIFELYPDRVEVGVWHYVVAYSFNGGPNDGAYPEGPVVENGKGVFFGATADGGQTGNGIVYKFKP
jgi:hypothetical protein